MVRKKVRLFYLLFTLLLSGAVIGGGIYAVNWVDRLIPTYKDELVVITPEQMAMPQMIRRNEDINHSMYPWNLYDAAKMTNPDVSMQAYLDGNHVEEYLQQLFYAVEPVFTERWKESFHQQRKKSFQSDVDAGQCAFLKDEEIRCERDGEVYLIDCAVQQDLGVLYFHKQKKERQEVAQEQLERAYKELQELAEPLMESDELSYYDAYINVLQKTEQGNRLASYILNILEIAQGNDYPVVRKTLGKLVYYQDVEPFTTDVIATDEELMLMITFRSSATVIFFYDPVAQVYTGYSIPNI